MNWFIFAKNLKTQTINDEKFNTFSRRSQSEVLAQGELIIGDDDISVLRTDTGEEYTLEYFLGEKTLVVKKPNSDEAWLFTKVGD